MTRANNSAAADLAAWLRNSPDVKIGDLGGLNIAPAELAAIDAMALTENAGALGVDVPTPTEHDEQCISQSIVLPLPPSTNDNWDNFNGRTVLSEAARNFRAGVKLRANIAGVRPFVGDVAVYVHVYRANGNQDLDNYDGKALLDALQGVMFHNDRQVVERHSWRHDDKRNPRVEVEVRKVEG